MEELEHDLESLGTIYLSQVMEAWEESYTLFEELEYAGKREFVRGGKAKNSMEVYDEMMQAAIQAFNQDGEYDLSHDETVNAFIYSANEDVSPEEFRFAVTSVLKGEKRWEDYARETV